MPEPLTHARAEALVAVLPDLIAAAHTLDEAAGAQLDVDAGEWPGDVQRNLETLANAYGDATADLEHALLRTVAALGWSSE